MFCFTSNFHRICLDLYATLFMIYNYFHNILRLFDVVQNFPFTPSETKLDYLVINMVYTTSCLTSCHSQERSRKSQKSKDLYSSAQSSSQKNFVDTSKKLLKIEIKTFPYKIFPVLSPFHMKTRACLKYCVNDCSQVVKV